MISQEAKNVMNLMSMMKLPDAGELPIELCRQVLADMMSLSLPPAGCRFEPVNAGGPEALWVKAVSADDTAVILYLHGGGYTMGSPQTHAGFTGLLSELSRLSVLSVDYRLAPENPYPAAIEDSLSAYRWLLRQGVSAESIVVGGDSAGGGLTFATMLKLKEREEALPAAVFAVSPWVDLAVTGESIEINAARDPMITRSGLDYMAGLYAGHADVRLPFISPLYADLRGLPPVLIHVGTCEMLLSDSLRIAASLENSGVDCTLRVWEDLFHVFHSVVSLPEAIMATEDIAAFVRNRVGGY